MRFIELKNDDPLIALAIEDELKNSKFEYISSSINRTYLLFDDTENKIVGGINYSVSLDSSDILFIYINKEYRLKGYSKELLLKSLNELKKDNIKEVFLEVKRANIIAYNLYKKCNFIEIGERKNYYSDGSDAILMKKVLG